MANESALDLEELRHLQSIAKRPRVVSLINAEISNLEKEAAVPAVPSQAPTPIPTPVKAPVAPAVNYSALSTFSWDQDGDKVKIYISLPGVDKEKLDADFKPMSVDVKFHGVDGKNYRFTIPKLHKEIVPENCKVIVKPTRVIISLLKASKGNWLDLNYKEDKSKPSMDKEKDPMSGIMDLMKNMYEEGDEEMKKTIAKAWTDARTGKSDPMKGYR
uniref:Calcyclin-binding protein n=1 Tax=Kalanchoe fedtschenkoi TaxID=63787 RepID=A0A7N0RFT3_KALFE